MQSPDVWSNQNLANELGQKAREIKDNLEKFARWESIIDDAVTAQEIGDAELISESEAQLVQLEKELDKYDIQKMLSGEYDEADAFLTVNETRYVLFELSLNNKLKIDCYSSSVRPPSICEIVSAISLSKESTAKLKEPSEFIK